jgi:hypothetical protein
MEWIVLCVRGGRIASYPLSAHNRELTVRLFDGRLIHSTPVAEYYDVQRAPSDREIRGVEFNPPNP